MAHVSLNGRPEAALTDSRTRPERTRGVDERGPAATAATRRRRDPLVMRGPFRAVTVYPTLQRLLDAGWVLDRWEPLDPSERGRPPRRYYRLTPDGVAKAQAALSKADRRRAGIVRLLRTEEA